MDDADPAIRRPALAAAPGELLPGVVGARDVRPVHAEEPALVLADRPYYQKP